MNGYIRVYELSLQTREALFLSAGLVGLAYGLAALLYWRKAGHAAFVLVGSLIWCAVAAVFLSTYFSAKQALVNHRCTEVEGTVEQFEPAQPRRHLPETFVLAGQKFSYSEFQISIGYHRTLAEGGVIGPDKQIRLCHLGGEIIAIDVR